MGATGAAAQSVVNTAAAGAARGGRNAELQWNDNDFLCWREGTGTWPERGHSGGKTALSAGSHDSEAKCHQRRIELQRFAPARALRVISTSTGVWASESNRDTLMEFQVSTLQD